MKLLSKLAGLDEEQLKRTSQLHKFNRLYKLDTGAATTRLRTYKKFIFVGDPFQRFVDAYLTIFINHPDDFYRKLGKLIVKNYGTDTRPHTITFNEFLSYLTGYSSSNRANTHWSPYFDRNKICEIRYDFIGKQETVEEDMAYLLQEVFHLNDTTLPGMKTPTPNIGKFYSSIPEKIISKLVNYYEPDFKIFGYNMSIPA